MSEYMRRTGRRSAGIALAVVVACSGPTDVDDVDDVDDSRIITQDPVVFAEELARIDYDNEVLVVMKDASEPGISFERLQRPGGGVIGLPNRPLITRTRTEPFANASPASRQAVWDAITAAGGEVMGDLGFPILRIRMSDAVRLDVVTVLLNHDNVDYIEPNRSIEVFFDD